MNPPSRRARPVWFFIWLILLAGAFFVDGPIAHWVQHAALFNKQHQTTKNLLGLVLLPGYFPFTLAISVLLGLWHPRRWAAALCPVLSGAAGGVLYWLIKWAAGRHRPVSGIAPFSFHLFPQGIYGLIHAEKNLCFPSGHATLAFATAQSLAMLLPRARWFFYGWAAIIGAERVLENAHYLSDVIAAAGIGIILAYWITHGLLRRFPEPQPLAQETAATQEIKS